MKIDSIQIANFRGIEHLDLKFDPHFTLLVGDNGSGKTSILSAVAVALGIWHQSGILGDIQWRSVMPDDVREVLGKDENGVRQFEGSGEVQIRATGFLGDPQTVPQKSWTRRKRERNGRTIDDLDYTTELSAVIALRDAQKGALPLLAYYGAGRAWIPSNEREIADLDGDTKARRLDGYYDCLNERIRIKDILKWFILQAAARDEKGQFKASFEAVRLALKQGIPGVDEIYWDTSKSEVVVIIFGVARPFSTLSDGQRTMAATIVDMAIRAATLNAHLLGDGNGHLHPEKVLTETPGVVLIDELDLHLHPRWQRRVVEDLRRTFPKVQFICTSHSPQVIGETKAESLRLFDSEKRKWETPNQSFGMNSNWILETLMGASELNPEVAIAIKEVVEMAIRGELEQAKQGISDLKQRVGNSEEIQYAASTIERVQLLGQ